MTTTQATRIRELIRKFMDKGYVLGTVYNGREFLSAPSIDMALLHIDAAQCANLYMAHHCKPNRRVLINLDLRHNYVGVHGDPESTDKATADAMAVAWDMLQQAGT